MRKTLIFLLFFNHLYLAAYTQPVVNSFSPASGLPGTIITITGKNFSGIAANNKVYFGAVAGSVKMASSNTLQVAVPFGSTYMPVSVTVNGLTGYAQFPFKLLFTSCSSIETNTFSAPVQISTGMVMSTIGDMDGDGLPDIVFSNLMANGFSVLQNVGKQGAISFAARKDFAGVNGAYGIGLGDFDGDGKTDVVVTSYSYGIAVFRNTSTPGNVSFEPLVRFAAGEFTYSVAVTDCDLDGRPDIIVTNHDSYPGSISIFRNTSAAPGALSFASPLNFTCGGWPRDLVVGDIDGDGRPEIITANQNSRSISILKNVSSPGTISYLRNLDFSMPGGSYPESVALGDINNDNKPDIAVANNDNPGIISILINTSTIGNLSFNPRIDFTSGKNPYKIVMEDLDGDGKTDIAVTNQETHNVSVYKNTSYNGIASFAAHVDYPLPGENTPRPLSIGDLDKDGRPDLIVGNGDVWVLKNELLQDPCNFLNLKGKDSVCVGNDTITYFITRSPDCKTATQFSLDEGTSKASIVGFTDTSVNVVFVRAGVLKLYASLARSCDYLKDSLTIQAFNSPRSLYLGGYKTICPNVADTLKANAGFKSYQWQDGSTDSVFVVTKPGLYYLTAKSYCNEIFTDTIDVTAAPPEIMEIGNDTTICKNDTLLLNASAGFSSFSWLPDYNISSTTSQQVKVFPGVTTTYIVTGIKNTGCSATDSIHIEIFPSSPIYLGKDTSFCNGGSMILEAGNGFLNYTWSTGASTPQIVVWTSGEYIVNVIDSNYCLSKDTLKIFVFQNPVVKLPQDSFLCAGNGRVLDAGAGFINYLWSDGSTSEKFHLKNIGKYWVRVTDANQCQGSDTIDIKTIRAIPENFLSGNVSLCQGEQILISSLFEFPNYYWSTGDTTKSITATKADRYWLQVTDSSGCKATEYVQANYKNNCIQGIHFPNAFTPNRDRLNDEFKPRVFTTLKSFYMEVYHRFGVKVFETHDWNKGWDGKYKGADCDPGIFVWYIRYQFINGESHSQKGVVTLIR